VSHAFARSMQLQHSVELTQPALQTVSRVLNSNGQSWINGLITDNYDDIMHVFWHLCCLPVYSRDALGLVFAITVIYTSLFTK